MEKYNYYNAVYHDIHMALEGQIDFGAYESMDDLREDLITRLWEDDNVTGNLSGSYTFSVWKAEENLCHNTDLLKDAADSFGENLMGMIKKGPEYCDISIRCYLLEQELDEYLESICADQIMDYLARLNNLEEEERQELEDLIRSA